MRLKQAILAELGRDELKTIVDRLDLADVDRRSAEAMRAALAGSRRATPEALLSEMAVGQLKSVCRAVGVDPAGRKRELIERLLGLAGNGPPAEAITAPSTTENTPPMARRSTKPAAASAPAETYEHPESTVLLRPDVGTQPQFRKKKPPHKYRYDSSLSPALEWDSQNSARELGEWLIGLIEQAAALPPPHAFDQPQRWRGGELEIRNLPEAVEQLKRLARPFLNWSGKAERLSFDVPTLPLFVHERLSTKAIIETLVGHKRVQESQLDLFGDPRHSIADQVLKPYEYEDQWTNRMILGDSLVVMNSLLHYERLGGQVQMIYMDPPYGVRFGSNFQPFVRKRDVKHGDDEDMTREPETVQAYRDTWELGLHSYLTYLRDRLLLCRELLSPSGSIFVQISDENLHHVKEVLDEVFGCDCSVVTIPVKKKGSQKSSLIDPVNDYLLWYSREPRASGRVKFRSLFDRRPLDSETLSEFKFVQFPNGEEHSLSAVPGNGGAAIDYRMQPERLFQDHPGARLFRSNPMTSGGVRKNQSLPYTFKGKTYSPGTGNCWKTTVTTDDGRTPGMAALERAGRLLAGEGQLRFKSYLDDFGYSAISNWWDGLGGASKPQYVVQTNAEIIQRCILLTTDPGDLVFDPTCGSGTTAYVAEQWGRRWITADLSRVPLALARQRLLTATFPWYELKDVERGPAAGFVYQRKQNRKGEEIGGIVPHITLKSIANNEPPAEEVLVDRPETDAKITRVTGPFCVEATIPAPVDWNDGDGGDAAVAPAESFGTFAERMLEVLRKSPLLRLAGNKTVQLKNIRPPAKSLSLSAEAFVEATAPGQQPTLGDAVEEAVEQNRGLLPFSQKPVALVFGPENGAVSERLVFDAAREAAAKSYTHLYVFGFAIQPHARELVEKCAEAIGIPATYVQATPDLLMGDLLKNMRSSQIFSVCGLPDVAVRSAKGGKYQIELKGLDVFDPVAMQPEARSGGDVPCWLLDTDYNDLCFHVSQAFFPKTGAWDNLKKALRGHYHEDVWDHLAGTTSAPFEAGEHRQVAVKVIDERGNELMVVKKLPGGKG